MTQPFIGYPALIWATCWQSMNWLATLLDGGATPPQQAAAGALVTYATLRNGASAVAAYQTATALTAEATTLTAIEAMALPLDPLSQTYAFDRIAATAAAASGIAALQVPVAPYAAAAMLSAGSPAVPYNGFVEWCMTFTAETSPALLGTSGIVSCAIQEATSWLNVVNAIQVQQGLPYLDYRYDAAARTWRTANRIATILGQFQSGPFTPVESMYEIELDGYGNPVLDGYGNPVLVPVGAPPPGPWNTAVALPSIMLAAASLNAAPATLSNQQCAVIRYALNASASSLAQLLLSLRSPAVAVPGLATLRIGESLQDLATRTTGDFENWPAIAALNALSPPYPGMSNTTLALKGAALLLPPASGTVVAGGPAPSYFANVLGTDWDFGPINGPMPPWIGDIPLITGYLNFARAIGRRLQTTLGTLIYHPSYGSRIPPEVGAVQGIDEAPRLRQYGDSAITLDPRTGSILSSIATTQPGWLATYSAVVQPIGPGSNPVSVNETLSPLP